VPTVEKRDNISEKIGTAFIIFLIIVAVIMGCGIMYEMLTFEPDPNYSPPESPHLYWKDVDVVITDIQKDRSFNGRLYLYKVTVTVKSKEYNLEEDFTFEGNNWYQPKFWNAKKGDTVKAQLYSWVMDSTGQIVKRRLNCLY
jgi:hypothetical protein